ncbi:hypothetical protein A3I42_03355 [Candidatus Uhrbacteria bacterium RIFCSPLOWO2_02_FULL_49_11]|uniref:Uncharacterized protein n=1 Tax=Candidatus Uhrbacteria bacterium RIFCSPLOWO2_02_FULL_49_11 TaxID=1802409 RepID=A0A1F7VAY3_9BACT|nr:MAG: hypothetical protein A3I42_03355 [Candidatus Uhrbacteria bacterium RIFCSPLOWO2_02_FULL_49_11]
MLVERQASRRKHITMLAAIVFVNSVVGYLLYQNFFHTKSAPRVQEAPIVSATPSKVSAAIAAVETLAGSLDRSVIESEEYRSLQKYGTWPLEEARTGKVNPFIPAFGP